MVGSFVSVFQIHEIEEAVSNRGDHISKFDHKGYPQNTNFDCTEEEKLLIKRSFIPNHDSRISSIYITEVMTKIEKCKLVIDKELLHIFNITSAWKRNRTEIESNEKAIVDTSSVVLNIDRIKSDEDEICVDANAIAPFVSQEDKSYNLDTKEEHSSKKLVYIASNTLPNLNGSCTLLNEQFDSFVNAQVKKNEY